MKGETLPTASTDLDFNRALVHESDRYVRALLEMHDGDVAALPHRAAMSRLLALVTVYTEPGSEHRGSAELPAAMAGCVARLEHLQGPGGLLDGTNLSSPPDSAFTINDACMALEILASAGGEGPADALADVGRRLRAVVERISDALVAGECIRPTTAGSSARHLPGSIRFRSARAGPGRG